MKFKAIITFFLTLICVSTYAIQLKHIGASNGLSSERTFSIEKDSTGFIWISTRFGIDRYDGSNVKQYTLTDSLGVTDLTGRINIVTKDNANNIWAFTNFGNIFKYDVSRDIYLHQVNLSDKLDSYNVYLNGIHFVDNRYILFYGSFGIWRYDQIDKTLKPIDEFENTNVFTIELMENSDFAISTNKGVYTSTIDIKSCSLLNKSADFEINDRVQTIYYDKSDATLLLGTYSGNLFSFNRKHSTLENLNYNFKTVIRTIKCYDNTIYIGTDNTGLITLDRKTKLQYENHINKTFSELKTHSSNIYDILYDKKQLWLLTYSDGVYLYDTNLPEFKTIAFPEKKDNIQNTFLEDSDGNFWYGTNNGLIHYNTKSKKLTHLLKNTSPSEDTNHFSVLCLCEDDQGYIWAGGADGGIAVCINKKTLAITKNNYFGIDSNNLSSKKNRKTYSIFKDSQGNIWLGGIYGLLTRYNPRTKELKYFQVEFVNTITEYNNTIMVGTTRGLYIQNNNDTFTHLLTSERLNSLMISHINSIYQDHQRVYWLGTESGLVRYHRQNDQLKVFSKADGLLSNSIFGILPDKRGRLWLSTEKDLICYNPLKKDFISFGKEEGLTDDPFSPRSQFLRKNGEMLFGNQNGITVFTPEKIDRIKIDRNLVLTDFYVNYKLVQPYTTEKILKKTINKTTQLNLKYNQNTFAFRFTTINYTNPRRTKIKWKLQGFDNDWYEGTNINNIYYSNVPPGKYKFVLSSINSSNENDTDIKEIAINIAQPFWATIWAKILYLLILSMLTWSFIQFFREKLEKRNAAEKIKFFTHTAHELKTPITLIKGPLNRLQKNNKLNNEGEVLLELVIKNTDRLMHIVTQLLDFQKSEISNVKLLLTEREVISFIEEKLISFRELAKEKNIKLNFIKNAEPFTAWFDEDKMLKIFNNVLSNAFKYTPQNGEITVTVFKDKKNWQFEVRDNGIGIPENLQKKIFKPFYRANNVINSTETGSGIGLLLTQNLVKLHTGTINVDSIENIGTIFRLKFPNDIKHHRKSNTVYIKEKVENIKVIPQTSATKTSILIVEDNNELRYFLKQCLIDKYNVLEASNGNEAIKLAKITQPELIISDVMMPQMSGHELCEKIKESKDTSHIPIIMLTALDDKENILKGYQLGADNYVTKPFDTDILILTVENTIATRQSLRDNLMVHIENGSNDDVEDLITNELDKSFLDEVMAIIDEHITDSEFSINFLCREIAMSRTSFYNKIKTLTNQSPNGFIRLVRLNRASKILKEQRISIAEVASATGFGNVKYFSTAFKKQFGVSPNKYRK